MAEISPLELKEGIIYRIVHRDGQIEEQVGVFDRLVGPRRNHARFTDIQGEKIFDSSDAAYRIDEWKFLKHDPGDPQLPGGGRRRRKTRTRKTKRRARKTRRSA